LLRPCSSKSSEVPAVGGGRCSSVVLSSPRKLAARFHHSAEYFGTIPFFGTITPSLPAVSQSYDPRSHHALLGAAIFSFCLHGFDGSFPAPPPECSSLDKPHLPETTALAFDLGQFSRKPGRGYTGARLLGHSWTQLGVRRQTQTAVGFQMGMRAITYSASEWAARVGKPQIGANRNVIFRRIGGIARLSDARLY
jgi:hypothetical protein